MGGNALEGVSNMLILAGQLPPWARNVAVGVIAVAVFWWLAGQTLVRNRRKLDMLWCAQALTMVGWIVAFVGFFSRLFGTGVDPFYGYNVYAPDSPSVLGNMTLILCGAGLGLVFLVRTTRMGLLLTVLQVLLGALGVALWAPWVAMNIQSLAYGAYVIEGGFSLVVVAALWQFKVVGDRMSVPAESG